MVTNVHLHGFPPSMVSGFVSGAETVQILESITKSTSKQILESPAFNDLVKIKIAKVILETTPELESNIGALQVLGPILGNNVNHYAGMRVSLKNEVIKGKVTARVHRNLAWVDLGMDIQCQIIRVSDESIVETAPEDYFRDDLIYNADTDLFFTFAGNYTPLQEDVRIVLKMNGLVIGEYNLAGLDVLDAGPASNVRGIETSKLESGGAWIESQYRPAIMGIPYLQYPRLIESVVKSFHKAVQDDLSINEIILKYINKIIADFPVFFDAKELIPFIFDNPALTDNVKITIGKVISDGVIFNEILSKASKKFLADNPAFADNAIRTIPVADTLAIQDSVTKSIGKKSADVEAFVENIIQQLRLTESISLSDQSVINIIKSVRDSPSFLDTVSNMIGKIVSEIMPISDTVAKNILKVIRDAIILTDNVLSTRNPKLSVDFITYIVRTRSYDSETAL